MGNSIILTTETGLLRVPTSPTGLQWHATHRHMRVTCAGERTLYRCHTHTRTYQDKHETLLVTPIQEYTRTNRKHQEPKDTHTHTQAPLAHMHAETNSVGSWSALLFLSVSLPVAVLVSAKSVTRGYLYDFYIFW